MGNKLHINWSTYNELCEKLILKIAKSGYEIDLIIAIMRGGAIPADLVSRVLKKDTAYLCAKSYSCLLYTSPSPRDRLLSRMPSSA